MLATILFLAVILGITLIAARVLAFCDTKPLMQQRRESWGAKAARRRPWWGLDE